MPLDSPAGPTISRSGLAASRASRSRSLDASAQRKMIVTSGRHCIALLHRADRLGSCVKMLLASSDWHSTECSLIWRARATPHGRLLFQLAPSTRRTAATACGSSLATWLTPLTPNGGRTLPVGTSLTGRTPQGSKVTVDLAHQAKTFWPTALANDAEKRGQIAPERRNGLPGVTRAWSTPRASDGAKGGPHMAFGAGGTPLPAQAAQLAWATPTSRDYKDGTSPGTAPVNAHLGRQVEPSLDAGSLNPAFVFWLMGYPPAYLSCAPPATRSSRKSPRASSVPCSTPDDPAAAGV